MKDILKERPVIPVIVIDDARRAESLAEALLKGGIDVIEITFRTAAAAEAIQRIRRAFPEMLVGAGTILTVEQAQQALDSGIYFGLAPGLNPTIVNYFQAKRTHFVPGVMTPSEVEQGLELGCEQLKFFPAEAAGGVKMLKALEGPYAGRGVNFCPTGGISLENMSDYLALKTVSNIGGTWLATKQQISEGNWAAITCQAKQALDKIA